MDCDKPAQGTGNAVVAITSATRFTGKLHYCPCGSDLQSARLRQGALVLRYGANDAAALARDLLQNLKHLDLTGHRPQGITTGDISWGRPIMPLKNNSIDPIREHGVPQKKVNPDPRCR
jgi:hypothetical protein